MGSVEGWVWGLIFILCFLFINKILIDRLNGELTSITFLRHYTYWNHRLIRNWRTFFCMLRVCLESSFIEIPCFWAKYRIKSSEQKEQAWKCICFSQIWPPSFFTAHEGSTQDYTAHRQPLCNLIHPRLPWLI